MTISRRIADVTKEKDLWVHSYRMPPDSNNSIKMEVGIEDCLHIEFEYNKANCVSLTPSFQTGLFFYTCSNFASISSFLSIIPTDYPVL